MGNKQAKEQVDLVSSHPNFKVAKVITENEHRYIKTSVPSDDEGYNAWKKLLSRDEKALQASHFILLPKKHTLTKSGLCSNSGNVEVLLFYNPQIDYDYYPYLLSEQIANRHEKQQRFRESDLWYLLYSLVGATHEVSEISKRVGDIRPENVFINYDGQVKIGALYSYPNEHTNYKKSIDQEVTLLAPEDLAKLQLGATDNEENERSEIFSIGLTVIAAGVLENPSAIYDLKGFTFNQAVASDLINKWKTSTHYSEIFRSIVSNLVQFNPENRLPAEELWKWIVKYEPNIKSKEKFLITSVPNQIEREVSELRKFTKSTVTTTQHQTYEHPKEVHA